MKALTLFLLSNLVLKVLGQEDKEEKKKTRKEVKSHLGNHDPMLKTPTTPSESPQN